MFKRVCLASALFVGGIAAVEVQAQTAADPFGVGKPAQAPTQPAAGQNPLPGAAPAAGQNPLPGAGAPASGSAAAPTDDKTFLDQMMAKKVVYKVLVKGKLVSLWVGAAFIDMEDAERTRIVRAAYKYLAAQGDPKFKSPMPVFLSDGQRQGPRLGLYTVTPKGDNVKFVPKMAAAPVGQFPQVPFDAPEPVDPNAGFFCP